MSSSTYPIAATATARAYDFSQDEQAGEVPSPATLQPGQQVLFAGQSLDPRVIPFDSLTSPAERIAIRQRATEAERLSSPVPERIPARRSRSARSGARVSKPGVDQRRLEFEGQQQVVAVSASPMASDLPVAPASMRVQAALIDGAMMAAGCGVVLGVFASLGGAITSDKHSILFLALALLTVPVLYKLMWAFAGRNSFGHQALGLEVVDFDGRHPSRLRRYGRTAGGVLSLLAGGIGMIWTFVDEDNLTWHDHMSGTFPTFSADEPSEK